MASKTLGKKYFPILRKTPGDAGRSISDPFGFFSCRMNVARFLDIDKLAFDLIINRKRNAYTRGTMLVDGTILKSTENGSQIAESLITLPVGSKGSRSVIIKSGKKTKAGGLIYHTLTFRFPSWATVWCISDALGEIIPAGKLKSDPTESDVFPFFTVKGGRTYPIMEKQAAEGNADAAVPATVEEANQLLQQSEKKGTGKKAAGGA